MAGGARPRAAAAGSLDHRHSLDSASRLIFALRPMLNRSTAGDATGDLLGEQHLHVGQTNSCRGGSACRSLPVLRAAAAYLDLDEFGRIGSKSMTTMQPFQRADQQSASSSCNSGACRGTGRGPGDLTITARRWLHYVINVDGTGLKNLTDAPGDDWSPDWSPDGSRIAFDSNRDGQSEIYVMNADGSGLSRLTQSPDAQRAPDWSSDGQEIVYSSNQAVAGGGGDNLFKMRSNGTQQLLMAGSPADDKWPDWIKGGQAILFTSYRDGNGELYVITSNGTGLRRLTTHPANDFGGVWRP